ncbi:MAG: type II secretion system F family protein [Bauldia sp.]|nr:type II secretion system F family protein [Bauldia sp.]
MAELLQNPTILALAFGALAMLSVGGIAWAVMYGRMSEQAKVDKRREAIATRPSNNNAIVAAVRQTDANKRRKSVQDTLKEMEIRQKAQAKRSSAPPMHLRLQQAGLKLTTQMFYIISVLVGLLVLAICFFLNMPIYATAVLPLAAAIVLPRWFVNFARKRRFKKFTYEFPNAVDVIVRGVKAGLPLHDCIRVIAQEAAEPVRSEFRTVSEAQAMGVTLADAVARMPERVPIPETNFFAIAIAIQQKSGGNLSEALGNLSRVLRERKKMKGKIGAMSMEAKASAAIIGALPFIVMFLVFITSPDYIKLLFTDRMGHLILVAAGFWMSCGIFVMRKMINFDY